MGLMHVGTIKQNKSKPESDNAVQLAKKGKVDSPESQGSLATTDAFVPSLCL